MDVVHYFDIILHPEETMKADVKNADMKTAMKSFGIAGAIAGFFVGLAVAFGGAAFGLGALSYAAIIVVPIVFAILMAVGSGFGYGLYYLVAKLLGGKGTFVQNYFFGSRLFWPMIFASIIVGIITMIPFVGWLVQIIWFLYTIYLSVVLISVANNITKLRAVVVYVLPGIIILAILFMVIGSVLIGALESVFGEMVAVNLIK